MTFHIFVHFLGNRTIEKISNFETIANYVNEKNIDHDLLNIIVLEKSVTVKKKKKMFILKL